MTTITLPRKELEYVLAQMETVKLPWTLEYVIAIRGLRGALAEPVVEPVQPTVESSTQQLVKALQESKGWLFDYADSIIRDAIDRVRPPERKPLSEEQERKAFENWFVDDEPSDRYMLNRHQGGVGDYRSSDTDTAWRAWMVRAEYAGKEEGK